VHRDEALLLAHRAKEAERVAAERDQRDRPERHEAEQRSPKRPQPLARVRCTEQHERQREPGGHLHAHASHERRRAGAVARS